MTNYRKTVVNALAAAAFATGAPLTSNAGDALTISNVSLSTRQIDPARGETVAVRFAVNRYASVELNWFDARDLLIRRISSARIVPAGETVLTWDGRDQAGRLVPNEAYHYTLVARAQDGEQQEFDLTGSTGGTDVALTDAKLNSEKSGVQYLVRKWSRVNIRIGMREGGPLLRSLENWQVRAPGEHLAKWDGMDASGVISIGSSEGLEVWGLAFDLPDNSVFVGEPNLPSDVVDSLPWGKETRMRKSSSPKRMYSQAQLTYDQRGDFVVKLVPHEGSAELLPVEVRVPDAAAMRIVQQRFELVYFVDGVFVSENEIGALPATWNVDVSRLTRGDHLLTVNARGYEGTFGFGSYLLRIGDDKRGVAQ